jgi:hypothetical protein
MPGVRLMLRRHQQDQLIERPPYEALILALICAARELCDIL